MSNPTSYNLPEVKGSYRFNADLSKTNWFRVGGKAEILFRPSDTADLVFFLKNRPNNLKVTILGVGSNVIIKDGGIDGAVIKLGSNFAKISHNNNSVNIGAGCLCSNAANYCKINALGGLEFLSGIPGSIGGALAMNAGCYGSDIASVLISATAIDLNGQLTELKNKDFGFEYRHNKVKDMIFTSALFKSSTATSEQVADKIKQFSENRQKTQPIRSKTGGSTFKNPEGYKAWQLIDKAGCRGMKIGDAQMSEKHCNFMINTGNAKASDLISLGNKVKDMVKTKTGINLEWEIKIIGKDSEN